MIEVVISLLGVTIVTIVAHSIVLSRRNIFEPVYFFLMGFAGVFVLQAYQGREALLLYFTEDFIGYCLFLAWVSLILFYIGYRSPFTRRLPLRLPQPPAIWPPRKIVPYGIFVCVLGFAGLLTFIIQSGGAEEFFSVARGKGNYEGTTAYISSAKWLILTGLPILFIAIARKSLTGFLKVGVYVVTLLWFAYQVYIGQRSGVFIVGVSVLAWWYLPRVAVSRIPVNRILALIILTFLLVGFVANFRGEFYVGSDLYSTKQFFSKDLGEQIDILLINGLLSGGGEDYSHGGELSGYLQTMAVVPEAVDHDYGKIYLRYLYHWIPRIVWPEKPIVKESMKDLVEAAPALTNGTNTMLGTYYYNFGLIGMFLGSFITGICLGALEYWRKYRPNNDGVLLIYLVFFAYGRGVVMGGGIFAGLDSLMVFFILPILGAFWYLRRKNNRLFRGQKIVLR